MDFHQPIVDGRAPHDAVAARVFGGHLLNGQDAGAPLLKLLHHLRQDGRLAHHEVIGQEHRKGFLPHQALPAQDGMPQAQRLGLPHIHALHVLGFDTAHHGKQFFLARLLECHFQLVGQVEVVFDGPLVAPRYEDHLPYASGIGLLDRVLNQGLVHHGQHFLGLRLGGRQKPRTQAGNGKDGFLDVHGRAHVGLWGV